ncbi:diguanylate cyclase (GGDEF)-like protein [Rhodoligotrophos appendicifer]|uniref:sensor domain-containing diguanylate cyclase n=1 Tax=Rhodoligotrophos appendicifer TaxID=987056 RepID=UPI0011865B52|nr:diguanylate cyclase [Rhodoligotrophos appendicifer]
MPTERITASLGQDDGETFSETPHLDRLVRFSELTRGGDLQLSVMAAGLAAYHWIVEGDVLLWSDKAADILGIDAALLDSGRLYAAALEPESPASRYDAVQRSSATDEGGGVFFQVEYRLKQGTGEHAEFSWVEDTGRWFAGADGRPAHVFGIVRVVENRKREEEHLHYLGTYDPLTGLMNRPQMLTVVQAALNRVTQLLEPSALLMISIDNLNDIRRHFGSQVADAVGQSVGKRLAAVMRSGDQLGRFTADKLALLLKNCREDEMPIAAARFLGAMRDTVVETTHGPVWVTGSVGGTSLSSEFSTSEEAFLRVEASLDQARRLVGGTDFDPAKSREVVESCRSSMETAAAIFAALDQGSLALSYQPVLRIKDHEVVMQHVDLAFAGDGEGRLMTAARKLDLIGLVETRAVKEVLTVLQGNPSLSMSMALSEQTLRQPCHVNQITALLGRASQAARRFTLQLPSSDLDESERPFVSTIMEIGVSLTWPEKGPVPLPGRDEVPVSILKFPLSRLRDAATNEIERICMESTMALSRRNGAQVLAVDVATRADLDLAVANSVDLIQGPAVFDLVTGESERAVPPENDKPGSRSLSRELSLLKGALMRFHKHIDGR